MKSVGIKTAAGSLAGLAVAAALSAATPAAAAGEPLTAGIDGTFAPHAMPKLGGGIEGFNIDLTEAIAAQLGRPIELVSQQFSGLIPGLNAGKFDFLMAVVTVTAERAENMLFVEGYLNTDYQFLIMADAAPIEKLEDLAGKVISVNKGSIYDSWARANAETYGFEVQSYGTNTDAVQAVMSGRAYGNLAGNTVVAWAAKRNPQLKLSYTIKTGLVWSIPFRKDSVELRNQVEAAVECLKLNGTIAALHEKWFGTQPEPGSAAMVVHAGFGQPGFTGADPTAFHVPQCK